MAAEIEFTKQIWVNCPNCDGEAVVLEQHHLSCSRCQFRQKRLSPRHFGMNGVCFERRDQPSDWYGLLAAIPTKSSNCSHCGNQVTLNLSPQLRSEVTSLPNTNQCQCKVCNHTNAISIVWVPYFKATDLRDSTFGCTLYFVVDTAKGCLFIFNKQHGMALLDYISADHRSDPVGHFKNLPTWIKLAKNRPLVIKSINRLLSNCPD